MRKEVEVKQSWGQLRRWTCSGCEEDFVYLAWGSVKASAQGIPYVSLVLGEKGLSYEARQKAQGKLRKIEASKRAGRARCPACAHLPLWMRFPRFSLTWTFYGAVLAWMALALALGAFVSSSTDPFLKDVVSWIWLLGSPLLGGGLGYWLALRANPLDTKPLSWSQFEAFRDGARAEGAVLEDLYLQRSGITTRLEALSPRLAPGCKFE